MNKWKIGFFCLLCGLQLSAFASEPQRVYLFGMATNFNDSTTYLTEVQQLDSLIINPDGSLQNHIGYTLQLKVYLEGSLNESNQTCAVFYSDKKRKLTRRFSEIQRRHQYQKDKKLVLIDKDAFLFRK